MDDQTIEVIETQEPPSEPRSRAPWLITGLIGALMLVVGLVLGYVGRGEYGPEAQAAKATASAEAVAVSTRTAGNAEMMNFLKQNTRHFKGDENAPVTLIEFSDFQ